MLPMCIIVLGHVVLENCKTSVVLADMKNLLVLLWARFLAHDACVSRPIKKLKLVEDSGTAL